MPKDPENMYVLYVCMFSIYLKPWYNEILIILKFCMSVCFVCLYVLCVYRIENIRNLAPELHGYNLYVCMFVWAEQITNWDNESDCLVCFDACLWILMISKSNLELYVRMFCMSVCSRVISNSYILYHVNNRLNTVAYVCVVCLYVCMSECDRKYTLSCIITMYVCMYVCYWRYNGYFSGLYNWCPVANTR